MMDAATVLRRNMSVVRFSECLLPMTDDGHEPIIVPRHAEAKQPLRSNQARRPDDAFRCTRTHYATAVVLHTAFRSTAPDFPRWAAAWRTAMKPKVIPGPIFIPGPG